MFFKKKKKLKIKRVLFSLLSLFFKIDNRFQKWKPNMLIIFIMKKESVIKNTVKFHDQNVDICIKFFKFEDFKKVKDAAMLLQVRYQFNFYIEMSPCFHKT